MVQLVDQNAHADQQFETFYTFCLHPPMLPAPPAKPPIHWVPAPLPALAPAPVIQDPAPWAPEAVSPAKISMGVPMDIDAARRNGAVPPSMCHHCRKPRHWACSCLVGLNVRYLLADKQDALIMELLAAKDASGVPSPKAMDRTEDGE